MARRRKITPETKPTPAVSTDTERLPVKLKPFELEAKAREMAEHVEAIDLIDDKKKANNASLNAEKKALIEKRRAISAVVRSGTEYRDVPVWGFPDWETRMVVEIRLDTYEELRRRSMTLDETQRPLFSAPPNPPEGAVAVDVPEAPAPDPNPAQLRAAGHYYGRAALQGAGTRVEWVEGVWPTEEQWAKLSKNIGRVLFAAEREAAIEGYRAEACLPYPTEGLVEAPADPGAEVSDEEMKERLARLTAIGKRHGEQALKSLGGEKRPAVDRAISSWPQADFWPGLEEELARRLSDAEKEACVEGYRDAMYLAEASPDEELMRFGAALAQPTFEASGSKQLPGWGRGKWPANWSVIEEQFGRPLSEAERIRVAEGYDNVLFKPSRRRLVPPNAEEQARPEA